MRRPILSGSLYRLVYRSRSVIQLVVPAASTPEGLAAELQSILAGAQRRNLADSITGALLSTSSGFAQVLEGTREAVERTFERISADYRHTDVAVLSFTPAERRFFPQWAMAFCDHTVIGGPDPLATLFAEPGSSGTHVTTGSDVLRILTNVVAQEGAWPAREPV